MKPSRKRTATQRTEPQRAAPYRRARRGPPTPFGAALLARVERAAATDPAICTVLAAARAAPDDLLRAAQRDPSCVTALAALFVAMSDDPAVATGLARVAVAAGVRGRPQAAPFATTSEEEEEEEEEDSLG